LDLPKTLVPADKKSVLNEVDEYIRKASKTLSEYFGQKIPECRVNGLSLPVEILSFAPDADVQDFIERSHPISC